MCQSLFFNKVAGLRPSTLFKKRPRHSCFPKKFMKSFKMPFWQAQTYEGLKYCQFSEAAVCSVLWNRFFTNFQNTQKNTCTGACFITVVGLRSQTLLKNLTKKIFKNSSGKLLLNVLSFVFCLFFKCICSSCSHET